MTDDGTVRRVACSIAAKEADRTIWDARGPLHRREAVIVEIEAVDGLVGYGYSPSWGLNPQTMVGFIINEFVDSVIGRSPGEVLDIHRELVAKAKIHGGGGLASSAIGGVDGALWDLHARSLDVPLRELFGSTAKTIPAYASAGFYESGGDESDFERDIQALVDAGYGAVKIKCGRVPLREDADRIRRAREILGPDIQLMVDANGAYRSVPEAMQMARTLAELDVSWFEEPLEIENERGYRELCRLSPVPVAAGENACTLEKIVRLIDAGVHVIQPDVGWTSGITTALAMAKVAEARGRTFAPHAFGCSLNLLMAAQVSAASPGGGILEVEYTGNPLMSELTSRDWTRNLDESGDFLLPTEAGSGFSPNKETEDLDWMHVEAVGEALH